MLIVITGPGSVGKDAITLELLRRHHDLKKVLTTTSRPPRQWEANGRDYHFVSESDFENLIANNKLVEHVKFAGNYYGTTKEALRPFLEGQNMVWKVEITRGAQIKELFDGHFPSQAEDLYKRTVVIYIDVPDWEILKERLKARGASDEVVQQRLDQDKKDWETYKNRFNNIVINEPGKLEETVKQVEDIVTSRKQVYN